jgi:hypothetical protein
MIFFIIFLVIVGVIVGTLAWFLINGANKIRKGIQLKDQQLLNDGLANIRNYFTMYGVLSLLGLCLNIFNFFN